MGNFQETYETNGLVRAPFSLSESLVDEMTQSLEKLMFDNPAIPPESLICPHIPYGTTHNARSARKWLEYASNPDILDLVESLIGPDIILWGSQVFCKLPNVGKGVPWHQDGHYWPIKPLATCSVWIALDPANLDNGCMRYIPGSHLPAKLVPHDGVPDEHGVLRERISIGYLEERKVTENILQRGELSLHDAYLIHSSLPNKSTKRRAGFVIRYMPSSSVFDREVSPKNQRGVQFDMSERPIWLLRGNDKSKKNNFEVGHKQFYILSA